MNPDYTSKYDVAGRVSLADGSSIYYEIRGAKNKEIVCLIMGAFATLRHFDELADFLASKGYRVLSYDHRGTGRSCASDSMQRQTSTMLAEDCLNLINEVFGPASKIHLYGASMGGCVAQHVSLLLKAESRLLSLYLAVTTRGKFIRIALSQSLWKILVSKLLVKKEPREMILSLLPKCFDKEFLEKIGDDGRSMHDRWVDKWTEEYNDWFIFHDANATASQCSVFATHYLSAPTLQTLISDDIPISVHIAETDELISPSKQRELAHILKANMLLFHGAHMGGETEKTKFLEGLLQHLGAVPQKSCTL